MYKMELVGNWIWDPLVGVEDEPIRAYLSTLSIKLQSGDECGGVGVVTRERASVDMCSQQQRRR